MITNVPYQRLSGVLLLSLLLVSGCQQRGSNAEPGFYSYVDAQGNLVTVRKQPEEPVAPTVSLGAGDPGEGAADELSEIDDETLDSASGSAQAGYTPSDVLDTEMATRDEQRFVTFPGYDGQPVTENLEKSSMEAATESRYPGYDELDHAGAFIETGLSIATDCCLKGLSGARPLSVGQELALAFPLTLHMEEERPASYLRIESGVTAIRVASFVKKGFYQYPQLVFLTKQGLPLLHVSNIFQRNYAETWYRFAYYAGEAEVPDGAAFVALYLGYIGRDGAGEWRVGKLSPVLGSEAIPSLDGEVVVRALATAGGN